MDIPEDWKQHIDMQKFLDPFTYVSRFLAFERQSNQVYYPKDEQIFRALFSTPYDSVKVVLLGQDPYHGFGQAHGLSFSVNAHIPIPPSLKNIYAEIQSDVGFSIPQTGDLSYWASQGVLLLNAILTVRHGKPLSHHNQGWEQITDEIIQAVMRKEDPVVFLLWGKKAQEKCEKCGLVNHPKHLALKAPHPSPFSAHSGFLGCKHFSQTNAFLQKHGKTPIDWTIT